MKIAPKYKPGQIVKHKCYGGQMDRFETIDCIEITIFEDYHAVQYVLGSSCWHVTESMLEREYDFYDKDYLLITKGE